MYAIINGMYSHVFELEEEVFKVIGNQKRLEIIQLLNKRQLNVSEMVEMLGLRQANLSQHLSLLRQHKLVTINKRGREVYYQLADDNIAEAVKLVYHFLQKQYGVSKQASDKDIFPIVADPVCGMRISASEAYDDIKVDGKTYYFCASGCKDTFQKSTTTVLS